MADIDVVPKHRSNMWIWIVLAIVVAGLIVWALMGRTRSSAELHGTDSPITATASTVYFQLS